MSRSQAERWVKLKLENEISDDAERMLRLIRDVAKVGWTVGDRQTWDREHRIRAMQDRMMIIQCIVDQILEEE